MGRFLNRADLENSTRVCVLKYAAASDLIGYADCIGEELSFNGVKYTVVGVLSEEENLMSSMMGGSYTATRVVLKRQGRHAFLTVESRGEEIAKDELEKIFLRFYRLDKARSMNHSYGLGLAIARQIAESHKGKIWAESAGGINRFCVQLPAE